MKRAVKKVISLVLTIYLSISIWSPQKAFAADTATAEQAKNGVVQVNTIYTDEDGVEHVICGGAGFIIGNAEETEYVITTNHIVSPTEDFKNEALEYLGVEKKDEGYGRVNFSFEVLVEGDVVLSANLLTSSSELDMAVLQLSQPIYTRTPLAFYTSADGSENVPYSISDTVYALGFPDGVAFNSEVFYFSNEQVSMSAGNIVNILSLNGIQTIEHSAQVESNNCGGPLVNELGYVIGMNTLTKDGVYNCAIDSTKIIKILDGLGIFYEKATYVEEESVEEEATEEELPAETDNSNLLIIVVCIAVVLVIALTAALIIVLVLKKDKKPVEKKGKKKVQEAPANEALARFTSSEPAKTNVRVVVPMDTERAQDTMVLGGGNTANETNVLGNSKSISEQLKIGTLIRQKTNEKIVINKNYFTIGKDSLHVDYCINDNGTISRQHCAIRQAKEGLYLEDCNSTNGTFLNGSRLISGKAELLRNGDIIRVSNEEFEFQAK